MDRAADVSALRVRQVYDTAQWPKHLCQAIAGVKPSLAAGQFNLEALKQRPKLK
jgi:hypothetical protein